MLVHRLSHIGICVPDLDQAISFYCEIFGFEEISRVDVRGRAAETLMELPGVDLRAVYLERDHTRIELLYYLAPKVLEQELRALNRVGLTHLSFRVSDIEQTIARVLAAGGAWLAHTRVDRTGFKSVFVLDPGRTRIELLEFPVDPDWLPGMPLSR